MSIFSATRFRASSGVRGRGGGGASRSRGGKGIVATTRKRRRWFTYTPYQVVAVSPTIGTQPAEFEDIE